MNLLDIESHVHVVFTHGSSIDPGHGLARSIAEHGRVHLPAKREGMPCMYRLTAFTTSLRPSVDNAQMLVLERAHLTKVASEHQTEHAGFGKSLDAATLEVLVTGVTVDEATIISAVRETMAAPDVRKYRAARGPRDPHDLALQYGRGLAKNQQAAAVGNVFRLSTGPNTSRWKFWQSWVIGGRAG
eukprot:CAMPEP_0170735406 /NCGR_PEP_ID=MMETSP0437-20130122/3080_1 /TAXON_ID=0 /ORGANISM="Sexangularia sp." /LENGTH=185 /DNA_ID=CAMNT_0011073731 /DNA_START=1495 /DNA_END=2050 /DNA_ORIENTATION=-